MSVVGIVLEPVGEEGGGGMNGKRRTIGLFSCYND